jgi:hypothetical protein
MMVSRHVAPAERLRAMLASGFLDPVLHQSGFLGDEPGRALLADPGFAWLVNTLGKRYVATGYVEHFGQLGLPAFIASSWVGGRWTILARLGFLDDAFPGFYVGRTANGRRIWRGHFPTLPEDFMNISFGVYEGVAFGVATREPASARYLMEVMERQARSRSNLLLDISRNGVTQEELPDLMFLDPAFAPAFHIGGDFDASSNTLDLQMSVPTSNTNVFGQRLPDALAGMIPMLEPDACIIMGGTAGSTMQALHPLPLPYEIKLTAEILYTHAAERRKEAAFVAWMPKWDHGGRLMGVRVPSVGMALEMLNKTTLSDILQPVLQQLNRRLPHPWGYVPYGDQWVQVLVAPSHHWYAKIPSKDRVGIALWNDILLLHSSADALNDFLRMNPVFSVPKATQTMLSDAGYVFVADLPACADALDKGFAGYVLWQVTQGMQRDRWMERLVKQVADAMREYAVLEISVSDHVSGGAKAVIRLQRDPGQGGA